MSNSPYQGQSYIIRTPLSVLSACERRTRWFGGLFITLGIILLPGFAMFFLHLIAVTFGGHFEGGLLLLTIMTFAGAVGSIIFGRDCRRHRHPMPHTPDFAPPA